MNTLFETLNFEIKGTRIPGSFLTNVFIKFKYQKEQFSAMSRIYFRKVFFDSRLKKYLGRVGLLYM